MGEVVHGWLPVCAPKATDLPNALSVIVFMEGRADVNDAAENRGLRLSRSHSRLRLAIPKAVLTERLPAATLT
jgi:hypothetical protein